MKSKLLLLFPIMLILTACAISEQGTIADLRDVEVEVVDTRIEGGLEKAMKSYQKFLEQTPESARTPDAIRRLADLNIEKEYGVIEEKKSAVKANISKDTQVKPVVKNIEKPKKAPVVVAASKNKPADKTTKIADVRSESEKQFEKRASTTDKIKIAKSKAPIPLPKGANIEDLETAGAKKAIKLYQKLLKKFPLYEHKDQVLYQMSRAYEEIGQVEKAMKVMNQLVREYPGSRHFPEVQFRRAEYYFTRKKYLDAEDAYKSIIKIGKGTEFYELALYKQGWTFYKQDLYEEGLNHFITLLDLKVSIGYDFSQTTDKTEKKRMDDTFRVISLSFSNMGGADTVISYFKKIGPKSYESDIYSFLAEFYLVKRRYSDAALTYKAFIDNNQFHKLAPHFSMRMIEIYHKGNFPKLVIEAKKYYSSAYGINKPYWKYHNIKDHPDVVKFLKTNIIDLANHYHAVYQDPRYRTKKKQSFNDAAHWYKEFLGSFPRDTLSPGINYLLADLYLENKNFLQAATEYEKTAYKYPKNEKSSKAGYAAVYAYREHLKRAPQYQKLKIKREVIRSSLAFVDVFPKHEKAPVILTAAADNLYEMKDFQPAINAAKQLIKQYPKTKQSLRRSAWLVIAYSSFDILKYKDSEQAYLKVLEMPGKDKTLRKKLIENLAAAIYKQGEAANKLSKYQLAADHFLRIRKVAPSSKILSTAEYDAATALIKLKAWPKAADVLLAFRRNFPNHKLQSEITKKIAYVYREDKKYLQAAKEFERIFAQAKKRQIQRESLQIAAELYKKIPDQKNTLRIYQRYVKYFPKPFEEALEIHASIAEIYKENNENDKYLKKLKYIINADAKAGSARTDRTRYLAGIASLKVIEPIYDEFVAIKLKRPFKRNLKKKRKKLKRNIRRYNQLVDYKVGDVTAAATYYIAETYYHFSRALMESERPKNLNALELEQYDLVLEEQAYPFEEKGINIHKKNIELLGAGVYSKWIEKSLAKLAVLVPGRYAKHELSTGIIDTIMEYQYEQEDLPVPEKVADAKIEQADIASEPKTAVTK